MKQIGTNFGSEGRSFIEMKEENGMFRKLKMPCKGLKDRAD